MNNQLLERFLRYVKIDTESVPDAEQFPSSDKQKDLLKLLLDELKSMGVACRMDEKYGYVYASVPANTKGKYKLGFIAHVDTSSAVSGKDVKPVITESYDGKNIALAQGRVLSPTEFPELSQHVGKTVISSDGTTLLGADDKAGIAEILTVAEELLGSDMPHGTICIGFTPDEEVGRGADLFDVPGFGADYAYTLDGGIETGIVYENFNACEAKFEVHGVNIHPGDAKGKMVNASLVAMEANQMLPACERPEHTEMYEGFYHLCAMSGSVEKAELQYIIRDHDGAGFAAKQRTLRLIEKTLNEKYGAGTVKLTIKEQYRNMVEKVEPCIHLIDHAKEVMQDMGLTPDVAPVRGGTDGARLSFMGLPCPNLGTGGYACHGPYEHITAEGMDASVKIVLGIIAKYAVK